MDTAINVHASEYRSKERKREREVVEQRLHHDFQIVKYFNPTFIRMIYSQQLQ